MNALPVTPPAPDVETEAAVLVPTDPEARSVGSPVSGDPSDSMPHVAPRRQNCSLRGRTILCIASDYDADPTGKHHIMRELSRDNHILWINYHGSRRPRLHGRDLWRAARVLGRVFLGVRSPSHALSHFTPLVLPGFRGQRAERVNRLLLTAQIRRRLRHMGWWGRRPVQVWSFAPDVAFLRGAFDEEAFVYYCVDDFRFFDGYDAGAMERKEAELLRCADVVFASSSELAATRSTRRPDIRLVRHGVQFDHFAQAWRRTAPIPSDLSDVQGPLFGFFGLISCWVDVELVAEVARLRPDYTFALIGECQMDVSVLRRRPNVRLLGRKPYALLPDYCRVFRAGLLPFRVNDLTRSVNPIKLREYLAAGLNVISTPMPEVEHYRPHVRIVRTAQDMAAACDLLAEPPSPADRRRTARCVADESWSAVASRLGEIVMQRRSQTAP